MAKLTLQDISNVQTSATAINDNFAAIEAAFENTVSRNGAYPNFLTEDLDFNGNQILNLPPGNQTGNAANVGQLGLSVTGGSVSPFGMTLQDFGAKTTQAAGDSFESGTFIQAAFDYIGTLGYFRGRKLFAPQGEYNISTPLAMRHGVSLEGEGKGLSTYFKILYQGATTPWKFYGLGGLNDWLYEVQVKNIYVAAGLCEGTYTKIVDIEGMYSAHFDHFTISTAPAAYTPLRVGYGNDITFDKLIVSGGGDRTQCVLVDATNGHVNKLAFNEPNFEVGTYGIKATCGGSTNQLLLDVFSIYTEALDTGIYWDGGGSGAAATSRLNVIGGNITGHNSSSIGVDIRRSNALVSGLSMSSVGASGVSIDNATTWANCHVIGGNLVATTPVLDTNYRLSTNTYLAQKTKYLPRASVAAYIADTGNTFTTGSRILFTNPTAATTGGGLVCIGAGAGGTATWAALANGTSASATPTIP